MDANTILRNVEIGTYEFDIPAIYDLENHELYRHNRTLSPLTFLGKWIALSDKTGTFTGIQGYVKLSVTVLGPDEIAVVHDEKDEEDEETEGIDLQSLVKIEKKLSS
jgi:hypothetical protein